MFEREVTSAVWGFSPTLFMVGSILHVISVAFPHWLASMHAHMGLWNACTVTSQERAGQDDLVTDHCVGITDALNSGDHSWMRVVQGLEIAATVFVLMGLVTGLMRVNLQNTIWQIACGLSSIIAGVLSISGAATFVRNYSSIPDQSLSWAFIFNAVSGPLCVVAGPILILDALVHKS